jgi:RHS repeat-associated protein
MPIKTSGATANNFRYSGERYGSSVGLYDLRARYYNVLTGRFETTDPAAGKITDPASLHKYVYAANNPVNATDPTGEDLVEKVEIENATIRFTNHGLIHLIKAGAAQSQAEIEALIETLVRQYIAEVQASGGTFTFRKTGEALNGLRISGTHGSRKRLVGKTLNCGDLRA